MTPANEAAFLVAFAYIALIPRLVRGDRRPSPRTSPASPFSSSASGSRTAPSQNVARRDEDWFDHPAYRQDIARTRRDLTKRRMNEESWKRASGQDIA